MTSLLLVVAAGSGHRLGRGEPKALVLLAGRPILSWTLEALASVPFSRIVVTAPPDRIEEFDRIVGARGRVVAGGDTRSASVRAGVAALAAGEDDIIAVHDAARPLVTAAEVLAVLEAARRTGAAIAATPVVDTVKRVSEGSVAGTVDRAGLYGAATPQVFRAEVLRRALAGGEATDESALCERLGIPVEVVQVSRHSFKITSPEDLELAEAIVAHRLRHRDERPAQPRASEPAKRK